METSISLNSRIAIDKESLLEFEFV